MRKLIDLSEDVIKDLTELARLSNRNLKNYIEITIIEHIKKQSKKSNK